MSESQFSRVASRVKDFLSPRPKDPFEVRDLPFSDSHRRRRRIYQERWDYYMGRQKKPLKEDTVDYNVIEPITTKIINDSVNFLFGPGLEFEIDILSQDKTPEEKF